VAVSVGVRQLSRDPVRIFLLLLDIDTGSVQIEMKTGKENIYLCLLAKLRLMRRWHVQAGN
jgi:hypothetical protein